MFQNYIFEQWQVHHNLVDFQLVICQYTFIDKIRFKCKIIKFRLKLILPQLSVDFDLAMYFQNIYENHLVQQGSTLYTRYYDNI